MKSTLTRALSVAAATLVTASGIAAGVGTATAADTSECATSAVRPFEFPLAGTYKLSKEVVGNGTVAPGGTVTFRTKVTGPGGLVDRIDDIHPAGFELVRAREDVTFVIGGRKQRDATDKVIKDAARSTVSHTSTVGWTTALSAQAVIETTYRVPDDAVPGTVLNSGAAMSIIAVGNREANPINVCVTIREPNAVEAVTGSLDGLGFGSLTTGSTALTDIATDPTSFSTELINGIDIGQLVGGLAGGMIGS